MKKRAFTILELIFVVVILGILAAIALPSFSSSKDDSEVSKSLMNLKTAISDISQYALKNDKLSQINTMTRVGGLENLNLSSPSGTQVAQFQVGSESTCVEFVFVNKKNTLILGLSSNATTKTLIENIASAKEELAQNPSDAALQTKLANANEALNNADFTSTSANKACVSLSTSSAFKDLASKTYTLLGA